MLSPCFTLKLIDFGNFKGRPQALLHKEGVLQILWRNYLWERMKKYCSVVVTLEAAKAAEIYFIV